MCSSDLFALVGANWAQTADSCFQDLGQLGTVSDENSSRTVADDYQRHSQAGHGPHYRQCCKIAGAADSCLGLRGIEIAAD